MKPFGRVIVPETAGYQVGIAVPQDMVPVVVAAPVAIGDGIALEEKSIVSEELRLYVCDKNSYRTVHFFGPGLKQFAIDGLINIFVALIPRQFLHGY